MPTENGQISDESIEITQIRAPVPKPIATYQGPSLLNLPPNIRADIFRRALWFAAFRLDPNSLAQPKYYKPLLHPCDLSYAEDEEDVQEEFDNDSWDAHINHFFSTDRVLDASPSKDLVLCRDRMKTVYGKSIPDFSVSVRVIQQVEYRQPSGLLSGILGLPGVNTASQLLVPDIEGSSLVSALSVQSPSTLAHVLHNQSTFRSPSRKYIATFGVFNHSNIFAWQRFTGLQVSNLTVRLLGTRLWDRYNFPPSIRPYRVLPFVGVIASIIANSPSYMRTITIAGLGPFTKIFMDMWEDIHEQTPLTGANPLLDILIAFPFPDDKQMVDLQIAFVQDGELKMGDRTGNLFGMRSSMQWQALIMSAKWGKHAAKFQFFEGLAGH
ncbi:hypothetical protein CC80DRAFT_499530 [Byssothecium circinans]|uniref:Uncharacterized protein n=1 Tax=Byssothecium circinans TaxID=147558 RepID=A0A6A5UDR2_9PLEO|nr:hypothetical protein CC80DRAFT_499530 [Byssothecium circinans]